MLITFSRFENEVFESIISYLGQGFPNFCLAYEADAPISQGNAFPLFRTMLGLSETVNMDMQIYALEQGGTLSYVFGTFLKSFLLSLDFIYFRRQIIVQVIAYCDFKINIAQVACVVGCMHL